MHIHGKLYVIGVGSGDPGLLTIKAADIHMAACYVYPSGSYVS